MPLTLHELNNQISEQSIDEVASFMPILERGKMELERLTRYQSAVHWLGKSSLLFLRDWIFKDYFRVTKGYSGHRALSHPHSTLLAVES